MPEIKESRPQTIWRHVNKFIHDTATSWPTFAASVRDIYEDTVPEHARSVQWSMHRDAHNRMRMDAQSLRRFEHDTKFGLPSELEEAIVIALQELSYSNYRQLETELAARYGLLAARIPQHNGVEHVGDLTQRFGEALIVLGPIVADQVIDYKDRPHARAAIDALAQVIASAITVSNQCAVIMNAAELPTVKAVS